MNKLEKFLGGSYKEHKRHIERINETIAEVIPLFVKCWNSSKKSWPYVASDISVKKFSFSTHTMILNSLELILSDATLKNYIDRNTNKKLKLIKKFEDSILPNAKTQLVKEIDKCKKIDGIPQLISGSFGTNDLFTLYWILQLASYKNNKYFTDENFLNLIKDTIKDRTIKWEEKSKEKKKFLHLLDLEVGRAEIDHSIIKLKANKLSIKYANLTNEENNFLIPKKYFLDSIHKQIAYYEIPDSRFDPAELVFALEGALQIDENALNTSLLDTIFKVFVKSQKSNPLWRPTMPFLSEDKGMVLFPISVEVANSLLRSCSMLDKSDLANNANPHYFSKVNHLFRRYTDWLQVRLERLDDNRLGWHSEHVNQEGEIHLWETSQVLIFLYHYTIMLQKKLAAEGLEKAGLQTTKQIEKYGDYWKNSTLSGFKRGIYSIHSRINGKYIKDKINGITHGSILLYGPPGTGKTTLAEQLATHLSIPLLNITVSDFLATGPGEVEARAKSIFQVLMEQRNIIILFDEIDQFLLDRNSDEYKKQDGIFKFMTPGMLTKLNDLKRCKQSLFIIATNYEERIDGAIKRKGRIDQQLLLQLPDKKERKRILKVLLKKRFKKSIKISRAISKEITKVVNDKKLLAQTVFYGFSDLKDLIDNFHLATIHDGILASDIITNIIEYREQTKPSINLNSYESRFKGNELKPYEEFFLLLYLLLESYESPKEKNEELGIFSNVFCSCLNLEKPKDGQKNKFSHIKYEECKSTIEEINAIKDSDLSSKLLDELKQVFEYKDDEPED